MIERNEFETRPLHFHVSHDETPENYRRCEVGVSCHLCVPDDEDVSADKFEEEKIAPTVIYHPRFRKVVLEDEYQSNQQQTREEGPERAKSTNSLLPTEEAVLKLKETSRILGFINEYNSGLIYTAPKNRR